MRVIAGLDAFRAVADRPVHLALGTFDGMHRGHRAVVDVVVASARPDGESVVTTFDPHPLTVLAPPQHPFLLSTLSERLDLFAAAGVDAALILRYDTHLRDISATAWLDLMARHLAPRHVVVASTHTFGRDRQGTTDLLAAWGRARGADVGVVPLATADGQVISSSGIRTLLRQGDVRTAGSWLGRWYTLDGVVVSGEGRGRALGVPTANLDVPAEKLIPASGVYATYARLGNTTYRAATNIGLRPTFGAGQLTVESHLIGAEVDAYGQRMEVAFVARLRPEIRFPGPAALRAQIASDVEAAVASLEEPGPPAPRT